MHRISGKTSRDVGVVARSSPGQTLGDIDLAICDIESQVADLEHDAHRFIELVDGIDVAPLERPTSLIHALRIKFDRMRVGFSARRKGVRAAGD